MSQISLRALLRIFALALLVGCAAVPDPLETTTWRDPNFRGRPFTKVFVIGLSSQSLKDQRGFENLMVSSLQSAGIDAVPGWKFVPDDRVPDQATIRDAVAQSGADATLLVRMGNFATEGDLEWGQGIVTAVSPNVYAAVYAPGLTEVDYQAANIFTTLFDVRTASPVWTYNPTTTSPGTLRQDAPAFANDVTSRLLSTGMFMPPM